MAVRLTIFGFGDDAPAQFQGQKQIELPLDTPATPAAVMHAAGFEDSVGLVMMINNRVVAIQDWGNASIADGDELRVLSALEGG